jgi:hypothetical protein
MIGKSKEAVDHEGLTLWDFSQLLVARGILDLMLFLAQYLLEVLAG